MTDEKVSLRKAVEARGPLAVWDLLTEDEKKAAAAAAVEARKARKAPAPKPAANMPEKPKPVAPPPMVRATPGGRALGVLAAVGLLTAAAAQALLVRRLKGADA